MRYSIFLVGMSIAIITSCSSDQLAGELPATNVETTLQQQTASSPPISNAVAPSFVSSTTTVAQLKQTSTTGSTTNSSPSSTAMVTSTQQVTVVTPPRLSVSQVSNLNPHGTKVTVNGSGYDITKGIYVILCTQAAPGPTATCIGGINIDGSSSSSVWVSSNPPPYGVGLTTPFNQDGSFSVELSVVAKSGNLDCTIVSCGVVTRSDHLRYADRSQDVFVAVNFSKD